MLPLRCNQWHGQLVMSVVRTRPISGGLQWGESGGNCLRFAPWEVFTTTRGENIPKLVSQYLLKLVARIS